ncbi:MULTISPECIES: thiazole synthase [Paenibacillus]|jgi:thiazole synthase|uniref:Thiazole synthase n=2 Tax=Paenibacillus barengoltzii TaxID=343517 RepID=R9LPZ0_9BACL|nr:MULTISPECIES: thiazole synthase [Paenibacillus]EOS57782.1 thiazole synthase [Paenibacillus barengoltzii G22]MDU0333121.1 thiazole synthase [Paenibacillus sp. 3LSP]MEC2343414.1 thiazole synthase [Paenibacillus barengoltzii]SME89634.1 thiazole-phosphate synthase [Paenibacillus barengoltzii]SME90055.1 thiazole-phosphate synthase [Paenibacillus barengoltzii J12]
MQDLFHIGGKALSSRLFIGTGKYNRNTLIPEVIERSGAEVITVALRRVNPDWEEENLLHHIPPHMTLLPNTSGARNAEEAIRIARLARAADMGNWIKLEVIQDQRYLLPDNVETIKATEVLAAEGFVVLPYMSPDLSAALRLRDAGAAAVMPLGSPIGSNRGLRTKELIQILIEESGLPVIVDAGIGKPSEAAEAMEMGAAAVLLNTAIATARDPLGMAEAFRAAVIAGRLAHLAGLGPVEQNAVASSPLTGFLDEVEA